MEKKEFIITSVIENIALVYGFITDFIHEFKLSEDLGIKMTLPLAEAVNNSILYGNKLNPDKVVKLTAVKFDDKVMLTVEDEGDGFDYKDIPDPTTPENLMKAAGRGLFLMAKYSDRLYFHKDGAKVVMYFLIK